MGRDGGSGAARILIGVVIVVLVLYAIKELRDLNTPSTAANPPAQTNSQPQTNNRQPVQNQQQTSSQPTADTQIGNTAPTSGVDSSTRHKYEWMSGDIIGQSGTCEFAISQPDQPLNITAQGQVASGSFYASSDAEYTQQKDALQQAAARGSQSGQCGDY